MTGHFAYVTAQKIYALDAPFDAIIQAAMRQADSTNLAKLKVAWPEEWEDLQARYNAPGGLLEGERAGS